jgi:hypothetical protein
MPSTQGGLQRGAMILAIAISCLFAAVSRAGAAPLNLLESNPGDVTTFSIDVEYNHLSGLLTANGTGDDFYSVLDDHDYFYPTTFSVTANLNPTTGALISGTVSLTGANYYNSNDNGNGPLLDNGNDDTLLTGNLTAFGFPNPTNSTNIPLEFLFAITGGTLQPLYYDGAIGGMIIHMITDSSDFTSGWPQANFSSDLINTSSDTFPVPTPEPSSALLLALGFLPFLWSLCRKFQPLNRPA